MTYFYISFFYIDPIPMKYLKNLFHLICIWIISHISYTIIDGRTDHGLHADIGIILGNQVYPDGSLSERLKKRLECGLQLYNNKRVKQLLVSGGLGKEGYYEAEKMKEYLLSHGVSNENIIVDNYGNNTRLTVKNTLLLKEKYDFNSALIVSQYFHITRTKMLFKKQHFPVSGVSPDYYEIRDLYALPREFLAYYTQYF